MGSPRAAAYTSLGCCDYIRSFPGASAVRRFLKAQIHVVESYVDSPDWPEKIGCSDWPVLTQASLLAARALDSEELRTTSEKLVAKTCEVTSKGTVFLRLGANPNAEELPTTSATFIEALGAAYYNNRDPELLHCIRSAVDWFLGANRLKTALYNFSTGGCYDAMTSAGVNRNQGTESTVYCLLAFLSLSRVIGLEDSHQQP